MEEDRKLTNVECPNCGFENEAELITTIRPQDQSLNELFNGDINRVICNQCAQEFIFESPLVFKSDNDDYVIYYNPEIAPSEWKAAEEQMQNALNLSLESIPVEDRPECRLTLNRNDFIEKIALYLAELDDKIIEYLKFHIYKQENYNPESQALLYDFSRSDSSIIEFSVLDTAQGKVLQNTQTPIESMEQMKELLEKDDCPIDLDEVFSGLYVQVSKIFQA